MALVIPRGTVTRFADGSLSIVSETGSILLPPATVTAVMDYLGATETAMPAAKAAVEAAVAANRVESDKLVLEQAAASTEVALP